LVGSPDGAAGAGVLNGAVSVAYDVPVERPGGAGGMLPGPTRGFVLEFDGTALSPGYVEVPSSSALDLNELTISMWIKPEAAGAGCAVQGFQTDGGAAFDESCARQALLSHGEDARGIAQYVLFLNQVSSSAAEQPSSSAAACGPRCCQAAGGCIARC
jgi:hypothetical protein